MDSLVERLFQAARAVREKAYAPYSTFRVGAALKIIGVDEPVVGCNVENASYGATVCAERAAVFHAVSMVGRPRIEALALVTEADPPSVPCGMCLQVLAEFAGPGCPVHLCHLGGLVRTVRFGDLLPMRFDHVPSQDPTLSS